jgi:hypothetical protein
MRLTLVIVWIALAAAVVAAMFHISFEVEKLEARLHDVNRQIVREQEAIHVLQAEWSYLNRPQRLEALSQELLPNLTPVASTQFTTFARLPKRHETNGADENPSIAPAGFAPTAESIARGRLQ